MGGNDGLNGLVDPTFGHNNGINQPLSVLALNLSFSCQNVRSMNISTKNDITTQKILSICSLKRDFIFLSDLRINSTKQHSAVHDLEKTFLFNGYNFVHNSKTSLRGVGILI